MSSFGGCAACGAAAGAAARREDLNVVVKRRAWAALARGLVVPVVVAEGLDRYLRVVVAAAAPGEEAAPVSELARRGASARDLCVENVASTARSRIGRKRHRRDRFDTESHVERGHETEVVRRPRRLW